MSLPDDVQAYIKRRVNEMHRTCKIAKSSKAAFDRSEMDFDSCAKRRRQSVALLKELDRKKKMIRARLLKQYHDNPVVFRMVML